MKILVQKFGGTSVATRERRLAAVAQVEDALNKGYAVVVVVSAMGRKGDPYATDTLLSLIEADDPVDRRELDILMSCGEAISSVVFASTLRARGHDVLVLNGAQAGIETDHQFGNARILRIRPQRILDGLRAGQVVVVTGFQGVTADGDVTTLGRGGSDTTATALGVALEAEFVDIFTDVEGVMTADPRVVAEARRLQRVTYAEACNFAYSGAKVIHPRAVEIAMQKNIPIRVRHTESTDEGTLITNHAQVLESHAVTDRFVTGVAHTVGITQLVLDRPSVGAYEVFRAMADREISVDIISVSPDRIAYTVSDADAGRAVETLAGLGVQPMVVPNCAKVAVVGAGIAGVPGIMARIVGALTEQGVEILQTADSHTTIWCLVRREQMQVAVRALHHTFGLDQTDDEQGE
ncbi:aspartate kinase [Alicyclobacillus contaminans]|uniref:aspartate kinase n=1 Tax=Alicyclobacillus contaminans TaxID=392016 RepID=UPI00047EBA09|nr:aspartate kinase [Alicyclobacillus contaminans]